jgi:hypothetical protein
LYPLAIVDSADEKTHVYIWEKTEGKKKKGTKECISLLNWHLEMFPIKEPINTQNNF